MQYDENDENNLAASLTKNPHIADGCHRIDCINSTCVEPRICYPLWGLYECRLVLSLNYIVQLTEVVIVCDVQYYVMLILKAGRHLYLKFGCK